MKSNGFVQPNLVNDAARKSEARRDDAFTQKKKKG
jgi:hypothetical protein